jgi:hypothetical protein
LSGPVTRSRGWWPRANSPDLFTPGPNRGADALETSEPPPDDRPIRTELVERVRREIAAGTYETPEKWEAALERLFKRLEDI